MKFDPLPTVSIRALWTHISVDFGRFLNLALSDTDTSLKLEGSNSALI